MLKILNEPYPVIDFTPKFILQFAILLSLAVFLILFIFQPFGLSEFQHSYKPLIISGYAGINFFIVIAHLYAFHYLISPAYFEKNWKVIHEIVFIGWNFFVVGAFNFLYSAYWDLVSFNVRGFLTYQLFTLAVGFLPIVIFILFTQVLLLKKHVQEAEEISKKISKMNPRHENASSTITIESESTKDNFTVNPADVFFISSADNYIEVYYSDGGDIKKNLIRATLKKASEYLSDLPFFFRCHRRYIVNLEKVETVSGNSQGLKLKLSGFEDPIPVSRNLNKRVSSLILGNSSS